MRRFLQLTTEARIGPNETVVALEQPEIGPFALEVTLLLERMIESLKVSGPRGDRIVLSLIPGEASDVTNRASRTQEREMEFALPRNQVEHLQAFLLRAFRDSMADVNHIHLEGGFESRPYDLTIALASSSGSRA